jgi:hypothetical protein
MEDDDIFTVIAVGAVLLLSWVIAAILFISFI